MTRTTLSALLATALLGFGGSSAHAQGYSHIDSLAAELQGQARDLYWEAKARFAHADHGKHLMNDAAQMYAIGKHVHDVAHSRGSISHLESDLAQLDRLFHHAEDLVEHIEHDAQQGNGHIHGNMGRTRSLLSRMENTIHHLRDDVTELRTASRVTYPASRPSYNYGGNSNGHAISVGGLRIRLGN